MPTSILVDAFRHHIWATLRLMDACAELDQQRRDTVVPGTYGSIIDTLRHIVDGDAFYLDVLRGGDPETFDRGGDLAALRAVMAGHDDAWQRIIADDRDPATVIVESEDNGYETHAPLGVRLAQALYHGTDHRSQVCTALASLGIEAPAIEAWDLAREDGRMFSIESALG